MQIYNSEVYSHKKIKTSYFLTYSVGPVICTGIPCGAFLLFSFFPLALIF